MDPVTAGLLTAKAIAEMITEIVKGQPPEMKAKAWERTERLMTRMEHFFGLDKDPS